MYTGPNIIRDGLVLHLDADNIKAHPLLTSTSLIDSFSWTLGSGSTTGYNPIGLTSENERVLGINPFGETAIVWETRPSGDSDADGGWNTVSHDIDKTKLYRFSVWAKRTSNTTGGIFYFGINPCVIRVSDNVEECNPYWHCVSIDNLIKDVWYLVVGHCFPYTYTGTTRYNDTGVYTVNGNRSDLNGCNVGVDCKWKSDSTYTLHRTYHFYCTDATSRLQFYDPRIDLVEGNEPTVYDLIFKSTLKWLDLSGNGNHATMYGNVPFETDIVKCFNFYSVTGTYSGDASLGFTFSSNMIPTTSNFTLSCWVKNMNSTVGQEGLFSNAAGSDGYRFGVGLNGVYFLIGPTYDEGTIAYLSTLSSSVWYNVVAVFSRSTAQILVYVNGIYQNYNDIPVSQTIFQNSPPGIVRNSCCELYTGKLSVFSAYNKALTSTEIQENYNSLKSRFGLT